MLQCEQTTGLSQNINIVWQPGLVDFVDPLGITDQQPQSQTGQTHFRYRAHHQQIVKINDIRDKGLFGKRRIRLVQHNQPGGQIDQLQNIAARETVTRWIIRTSDKNDCWIMLRDSRAHGRHIELKVVIT